MKIFVVNCGSSSIKYELFDMPSETSLVEGVLDRVGSAKARLTQTRGRKGAPAAVKHTCEVSAPDHSAGMRLVLGALTDPQTGVLTGPGEIDAVGHRVVHGGEQGVASARIDAGVRELIVSASELAPLHNPANLAGIDAAISAMPGVPHVAVFDTAFLATLDPVAYRYAVPAEWYTAHGVRVYGFHGTSHRFLTETTARKLGRRPEAVNLITCHLGNGCSMTAVAGGRAVDHSMGLTPLEGLVMGTRSGDIDPGVIFHMQRRGFSPEQIEDALNHASGLRGLSGISGDMRDVLSAADAGDKNAELAVSVFVYRIVKYVGAYWSVLPGLDAIVLSGGIGENAAPVRSRICAGLQRLGVVEDPDRNARTVSGQCGPITTDDSDLPVWVVPTDEELVIARDTSGFVGKG